MALSLKHPTTQDLPHKLPREFIGQWQDVAQTPEFKFVKEIEIRESGQGQTISGMAELTHGKSGVVFSYYPTFTLREERPRRLKAWFEILTAVECRAGRRPRPPPRPPRGEPQPGNEEFAGDDQHDHPRRNQFELDEAEERGQHEDFIRDWVHQDPERALLMPPTGDPAVKKIRQGG